MLTRVKDAARFAAQAGLVSSCRAMAWYATEQSTERRLGIRSASFIDAAELSAASDENEAYEATGYHTLRCVFERIAPREGSPTEVLLDAGCGMGRVMAYAATFNFKRVLGFDIAPSLIATARRNLAQAAPRLRCPSVQAVVASAADYEVPDDVTTVFCFNPFYGSIMGRFIEQVRESLARRPRALRIVFVNPRLCNVDLAGFEMTHAFSCFDPRMGLSNAYRQRVEIYTAAGPAGAF